MLASKQNMCRGNAPCRAPAFSSAPVAPRQSVSSRSRQLSVFTVAAATVSTNDFKNGLTVEVDSVPYKVIEFLHVKPGKGAAFVRSKLKNCLNGNTMEKTFRAGEMLNMADISKREAQYTYAEGDEFVFMDQQTYEETRLKREEEWAKYMKEGTIVLLQFYNGKVISVEPPNFMELQVVATQPNVKGNTVSGSGSKPATLETGAVITVPLFIDVGETIKVDTRTDTYLSRSKE